MIFYTLQGPGQKLEIHHDKVKLIKTGWLSFFRKKSHLTWDLQQLSDFHVSVPKLIWGKIEWSTFDGQKHHFRFSTNALMVSKIEKYLQKLIIKNHQRRLASPESSKGKRKHFVEVQELKVVA